MQHENVIPRLMLRRGGIDTPVSAISWTRRMVMPSRGIECTIVNGVVTYAQGALTGAAAGRVLRS